MHEELRRKRIRLTEVNGQLPIEIHYADGRIERARRVKVSAGIIRIKYDLFGGPWIETSGDLALEK